MISILKKRSYAFCLFGLILCLISCGIVSKTELIDIDYPEYPAKRFILDNGMTVILSENHRIPFVAIEVLVKVGSSLEEEFISSGISHLVEHMLFKGTKKRQVGKIEEQIRSYGAQINGFTSFDYTGYTINAPKEHLKDTLELLCEVIANPIFLKSELEKEKQVILKEIDMNYDEPQKRLSQLFYKIFYSTHTYRYPIIGERKFLNSLTREEVLEFYKRHYVASNMVLVISGDIATKEVENLVKSAFGRLNDAPLSPISIPEEPKQLVSKHIEENYEGNLTYLMLGFHSVSLLDEDLFALDLLSNILGGTKTSRLFKILYDKKTLVYNIGAYNYTPKFPGVFAINAIVKEKKQEETIKSIFDEIEKVKKGKVSFEELNLARNNLISSFVSSLETIQSQASDFASSEALTGNFRFSKYYIEKIRKITKKEIIEVAKKYLDKDNSTIVVLKPASKEVKEKKVLGKGYDEKNGKIALKNGLRIVYSKKGDSPRASITVVLKGGLLSETKTTNGISNLTANMLLKGTESKDAELIQKIVENLGGDVEVFSGNSSFGIRIDVLNKNIKEALGLIYELITKSVFPKEELQKEKNLTKAKISERDEDIYSLTLLLLKQLLFKNHPYGFDPLGTNESVEPFTRRDIINFCNNYGVGNNMVISIVGNFNEKKMLNYAKKNFQAIRSKRIALFEADAPSLDKPIFKSQVLPKKEAVIMIGFKAPSIISRDRFVFEILESVLSGEDGRFFQAIRQKRGLSYTQGAFYTPMLISGYFVIYASVDKDKVELTKALILRELEKLKVNGVTKFEFSTAKKKLLSKHWLSLQTNTGLSLRMALDELYGLGYDSFKSYGADLDTVMIADIKNVLTKYLNLKSYAVNISLPSE